MSQTIFRSAFEEDGLTPGEGVRTPCNLPLNLFLGLIPQIDLILKLLSIKSF